MTAVPQFASPRRTHRLYLSTCPECHVWFWFFKNLKRHWHEEHA